MMKNISLATSLALVGFLVVAWSCGGSDVAAAKAPPAATAPRAAAPQEAAPPGAGQREGHHDLRPCQRELLQLAFDAASAFPLEPHRKNRSRAQEQVVTACFELGQPELAVAFATRIADWRRGCAYADFAWFQVKAGNKERALEYIELADGVAKAEKENPNAQDWRRDLIALKIARVYAALGDEAGAAKAAKGIDASSAHAVDSSWAATESDRVSRLSSSEATAEFAAIDLGFASMTLGQRNTALATVAKLHERFHADATLRAACEQRVAVEWNKLPPALRLQTLATMVHTNVAAGDVAAAKALVAAMRGIFEGYEWKCEVRIPEASRLIELAFAVGDRDRARAEAEAALVTYHKERETIVDIYRAETLRPLAMAWYALGEPKRGEELLALVLEEGIENPNSRPRCDDLVDTCVAMAKRDIEPSESLWTRMRELQRGLGNPW